MLLLKRRLDQALRIGPDVEVKVIKIEDGAVTLGVTAPPAWKISREEPDRIGASAAQEPPQR